VFYLFLDESGDLGFDFSKPGTTKYFVVTVLLLPSAASKRAMEKAVERTVKLKVRHGKKRAPLIELKGSKATRSVKTYFYRLIRRLDFSVYAVIIDKQKLPDIMSQSKARLYNHLARKIIDRIPFDRAQDRILITLDRNKALLEFQDFNRFLLIHVEGVLDPKIPVEIFHADSAATKCLQAVDMMSSAIFHKYEWQNSEWYDQFSEKIEWEETYFADTK
jgi:hypothetical protein